MRSTNKFAALVLAAVATLSLLGSKAQADTTRVYTEEEVRQCVADCQAIFETPGYGLKQCVSKCLQLPRTPMRDSSVFSFTPGTNPNFCETYEPGCEEGI